MTTYTYDGTRDTPGAVDAWTVTMREMVMILQFSLIKTILKTKRDLDIP